MTVEKISSTNLNTLIKKTIQIPIEDNFICLRSLNPKRTRFEVEYSLEKGSCTNSFLFKSSEDEHSKSHDYILIHPPGLTFEQEFLEDFNKKELVQLPFSREYSTSNLVLFGFRLLKQMKLSSMGI